MKDQGLVSVHIGPENPDRNISGPVAVLMSNEEYFLGAYIGTDDKLVLEMMPKKLMGTTAWPRHYPYSEQLLRKIAELEGGSVKLATEVFTKMGEKVEPPTDAEKDALKGEVRVYGNGNPTGYPYYGGGRRTTFASPGYGSSVLEEIKTLAKTTKEKVEQVGGTG